MPVDKSTTGRRALQPACDACHVRRVKCSHDQPCAHCARLGLSCTYTKASTTKKTAGKRIEALRQAERSNTLPDVDYRDSKTRGSGPPPHAGHPGWNGHYHGSSEMDAARLHNMQHQREHHHHYYTSQSAQGQQGAFPAQNSVYPPQSPTPWNSMPSPRSRTQSHSQQQETDFDRQVRFQHSQISPTSARVNAARASYDADGAPPYPGHQQTPVGGEIAGAQQQQQQQQPPYQQFPEDVPYAYLPSPSQYFGQPPVRLGSSFSGPTPNEAATATSTSSVTLEDSMSVPMSYPLQASILPPFSTSMADQLFNEQGVFNAQNFFTEAIPSLVPIDGQQTMLDMLGACAPSGETPGSMDSSSFGAVDSMMPFASHNSDELLPNEKGGDDGSRGEDEAHALSDSVLIPTLALFYDKLGGVMPVFSRNWLFTKLDRDDHHHEPQFAAMLLAMSALTMIQAQPVIEGKEKRADRMERRRRRARATRLLDEALKTRESPLMGQHASLEACFTSFFVFAALFGLGEHSAAWYRLRESITLGHLCRLHEPASYEGLDKDEAERRLRAYWLLAITERAFAIQRGTPIILTGNPRKMTANLRAKFGLKELSDFPDLQLKLFDVVDENFVDCWNRKCPGQGCKNFDRDRSIALWRSFTDSEGQPSSAPTSARERSFAGDEPHSHESSEHGSAPSSRPRSRSQQVPATPIQRGQIQKADVEVTRHWLLNRLWLITLSHGLLSIDAREPPLRVDHAIHVAKSVLDVCNYNLSLASMEAHGVGFTYKLYDIAQTLVMLCKDEKIAEAISKGVDGDQLKAQTTAAHTNGRGILPPDGDGKPDSTTTAEGPVALVVDTSGPAGLRKTVLRILNEYLILFEKFRGGDHPYLGKLEDSIKEVQAQVSHRGQNDEGEASHDLAR